MPSSPQRPRERLGPSWRGSPVPQAVLEQHLPARSTAPQVARQVTRGACRTWRVGPACDAAILAVSELVGNAVRHGGPGQLVLRLAMTPRRLRLEVTDSGDGLPGVRRPTSEEEGGRGLLLVSAVSARWGVRRDPVGKTVWVEIALPVA